MSFDRTITYQDEGASFEFTSVAAPAKLYNGPATTVCTVRPVIADTAHPIPVVFVLKEISIAQFNGSEVEVKKGVLALEDELVKIPVPPSIDNCFYVSQSSS
jgi:hypothetical protein